MQEGFKRFELKGPFLLLRTKRFLSFMDRLGRHRLSRPTSALLLYLLPLIAGVSTYLLLASVISTLQAQEVREISRHAGLSSYILIPGLNPYLPLVYGWVGIAVGILVHETAHGIVARSKGVRLKSSGILLLGPLPIGAFVEIDEDELKRLNAKGSISVLSAGPSSNVLLALLSLLLLLLLVGGMRPAVDGLLVVGVLDGYPAKDAGIMVNDVIVKVNEVNVKTFVELSKLKREGTLTLEFYRPSIGMMSVSLKPKETDKGPMIGVRLLELGSEERLERYRQAVVSNPLVNFVPPTMAFGFFPFSEPFCNFYTHPLGPIYHYLADLLYWIWFMNVSIGIFNAVPIYPLDGGKALKLALGSLKLGVRTEEWITVGVSLIFLLMILIILFAPYVLS